MNWSAYSHFFQPTIRPRETSLLRQGLDRQWARTILRRTLGALREKFRTRGRSETLRELEVFLGPDEAAPAYAEVAAKLGQTENTVAAAVRRLRQEFRSLLRQEVADTLTAGRGGCGSGIALPGAVNVTSTSTGRARRRTPDELPSAPAVHGLESHPEFKG